MDLAKELGCSLAELTGKVTPEELALWNTYFQIKHEETEREAKRRKR
jgi:hypothetical protein